MQKADRSKKTQGRVVSMERKLVRRKQNDGGGNLEVCVLVVPRLRSGPKLDTKWELQRTLEWTRTVSVGRCAR